MKAEESIPVSGKTLTKLKELAEWSGVSVEEALARAVEYHNKVRFWEIANEQYAALRADPEAWAHIEAERRLWEVTLMDGLAPDERWAEDGGRPS